MCVCVCIIWYRVLRVPGVVNAIEKCGLCQTTRRSACRSDERTNGTEGHYRTGNHVAEPYRYERCLHQSSKRFLVARLACSRCCCYTSKAAGPAARPAGRSSNRILRSTAVPSPAAMTAIATPPNLTTQSPNPASRGKGNKATNHQGKTPL